MEPIEIHVRISPDDEVQALRARVAALEAEAVAAQGERDRLEYLYRCECIVNAELVDLCRAHNVKFRAGLRQPRVDEAPVNG